MATAPSAHSSTGRPTWRAIGPLCLTVFAVIVNCSALSPLATEVANDLDTSVALVGQVVTLVLIGMGLASLAVGPLADRIGYRRTIVFGLLTLIGSAVAMSLAPSLWVMLLSGLLTGAGASIIGIPLAIAVTAWHGDSQRRALSRIQSAQTLGAILGAPILTAVAAATLWRGAYVVIIVTYAAAIVFILWGIAPDRRRERGQVAVQSALGAYRPLVSDRVMRQLYAASAASGLGLFGPAIYLGAFYTDVHNLSLRQVGLAYMVMSCGMFLGNLAAGEWLARFDLRRTCAWSTAMIGLGQLIVFTLPLTVVPTVAIVAVTMLCAGVAAVTLTTLMAASTSAGAGTTMTLHMSATWLGSAVSVAAGGALISLGGYQMLGIAFPAFLLLSALFVWMPGRVSIEVLDSVKHNQRRELVRQ